MSAPHDARPDAGAPRWEWRACAPALEAPDALADAPVERCETTYFVSLLAPTFALAVVGGERLELTVREGEPEADGCERWARVAHPFEVPPWDARALARQLAERIGRPLRIPVRPVRGPDEVERFLHDTGLPQLRSVVSHAHVRRAPGAEVELEHARLELDLPGGVALDMLLVSAPEPAAVRAAVAGLTLPRDAAVGGLPALLLRRLGGAEMENINRGLEIRN